MNNKISIKKFWSAGGLCEIELNHDFVHMINEPFILYSYNANSFIESLNRIKNIKYKIENKFHIKIENEFSLIKDIRFTVDRISYKLEHENYFPYAILLEKCPVTNSNFYLIVA